LEAAAAFSALAVNPPRGGKIDVMKRHSPQSAQRTRSYKEYGWDKNNSENRSSRIKSFIRIPRN
jgi:hypothetical protein